MLAMHWRGILACVKIPCRLMLLRVAFELIAVEYLVKAILHVQMYKKTENIHDIENAIASIECDEFSC